MLKQPRLACGCGKLNANVWSENLLKLKTQFGEIDVKIGLLDGKQVNAMPEFDQLKRIAVENNIPLKELKEIVLSKIK